MRRKKTELDVLYDEFSKKMHVGQDWELDASLRKIKEHKGTSGFGKICNKVMWRLISSAKRANINGWDARRNKMLGVLFRASNWLEIDNRNKRMAISTLSNNEIPVSENLRVFLTTFNPDENEDDKKEEPTIEETYCSSMKFFRTSENYDIRTFTKYVKQLLSVLGDKNTDARDIHFSSVYAMMQRRVKGLKPTVQIDLFNEKLQRPDTIDKGMVVVLAKCYSDYIANAGGQPNINTWLLDKFPRVLSAIVRKNSYSRKEVKHLAKELKLKHNYSYFGEKHLNELGAHLVDVYDEKQNQEIKKLNEWMRTNEKKQPLSRLAQTIVYIDMLYQKLIDETDIGKDNFNKLYAEEKNKLMQEQLSRYSAGEGSNSEIQQKIEEEYMLKIEEKLDPINTMMDRRCRDSGFYYETKSLIQQRGLKYEYRVPLKKTKDNSFDIFS